LASSEAGRRLFTIPPWRPFADDLAAGLLARAGAMDLARTVVLLPGRRAVRALTEALVRTSGGRALLLPRMVAIGDLDEEDLAGWEEAPLVPELSGTAGLLPEIAPLARQVALARILADTRGLAAAEAMRMGRLLGAALDTLEIEGRRASDLADAVPAGELQAHWAENAKILEAVMTHWPALLEARGAIDAARRRNLQLDALAARWSHTPPPFPVLLAGFASAPPAVARLARAVVRLEHGLLVLPGLDPALSTEGWAIVRGEAGEPGLETHPQHGMARLLHDVGLSLKEAQPWPFAGTRAGSAPERAALVARALEPPGLAEPGPATPSPRALAGVRMVEAANPVEEALLIALALRQIVEQLGRTAALVTPDRALAARVTVQLRRFGIDIDDSAGRPLAATLPGSLLVALATAAAERFAPNALLALLQHPLVCAGDARLGWLGQVRLLDRLALRGIRPGPGLSGVAARLRARPKAPETLRSWWQDQAAPLLAPLDPLPGTADALLDRLRAVAEGLAGEALWAGEGGRALARLFEALEPSRAELARLRVGPDETAALVTTLLSGVVVRPRAARHPQLAIWGPLEARLQSADLLVLGGLNEGSWPGAPAPDPFLAPAIRRALGLPGLARRIGLQAQDFASATGAPELLVTRAAREGGAPTVASRFWQRLVAACGSLPDGDGLIPSGAALRAAARALDRPAANRPCPRPEPAPPAAERPRALSVTEVVLLKADPFAFYARRMLGLQPLDPRDAEPTAGERGQVVHRILERWLDEKVPPHALDALIDEELLTLGERPEIAALWRPRVARMIAWAVDELIQTPDLSAVAWEAQGVTDVRGVNLKGRVDRIDRTPEGLRIIDYKTGGVPSGSDVANLWQTQLALLAGMATRGAFGAKAQHPVAALDYLKLSGGREAGSVIRALRGKGAPPLDQHIADAWQDLEGLVDRLLLGSAPFRAKASLVYGRRFRDFDHLARLAEWR
jgi:ATP-dependent helicase/nuclease subunit B